LGVPLDNTQITRFSNDNLYIQLGASVRYRRVYIVQSLSQPVNDHLMELLMMLDIARGAAAAEVHAIIPYYSFARSDKKDAPRISITARLVADLLKTAGATHVMSMIFHSPQVHGFSACLRSIEQLARSQGLSWNPGGQRWDSRHAGYGTSKIGGAFCKVLSLPTLLEQGTGVRHRYR
jgi:ribose-phosphate pyrophosphokinase